MAKHEFSIMKEQPKQGHRYDKYEPEQYNCIVVDDDDLEDILQELQHIDFYWHTVDMPGKGIAYAGITLIPPGSMKAFLAVIENIPELIQLKNLMNQALDENKWMIHFGI